MGLTRHRVASVRLRAERSALTLRHEVAHRSGGADEGPRILCYHSIGQPAYGVNDVTPAQFRRHIELVLDAGRRFVEPADIAAGRGDTGDVAITFDDGLVSVLTEAVPVLHDYDIPATCFVVATWPDHAGDFERNLALDWAGVRELRDAGVTIGSHSMTHPDFAQLDETTARTELVTSRQRLEDELQESVTTFAIPFGSSRNWRSEHSDMAAAAGYDAVYAQSARRRPAGTVPRTFVTAADGDRRFGAALGGAFDNWEEWC